MEFFVAPGEMDPVKYTEIGVTPNNIRFVAEITKADVSSWVNSSTRYFPETCTVDKPCACADEISGVRSTTHKFQGSRGRANSWASSRSIPWSVIGATAADLPIKNESTCLRANFYRIA